MSNIVVLSTLYLNIPSANGLCARNLVDAFRNKGHEVYVVCYEKETLQDEQRRDRIFTVQQPANDVTHSTLQKIIRTTKVLLGSTRPLLNEQLVEEYYQRLCEISRRTKIDAIIAMYFPFESVEAMNRFSKHNKEVKTFIYELDSQGDGVSKSQIYEIYNKRYETWLKRMYKDVTAVIVMKSHEAYWKRTFEPTYSEKLLIADLPILRKKSIQESHPHEETRLIYSGLIEKRYRSPSYLLSVLKELHSRGFKFYISFYSKGDCEDEIATVAREVTEISQHGFVTPDELDVAINETDVLISIGNSFSRSVPSKIISYLSYGKPIIHFSAQENDVCNEYLSKYDLALVVKQTMTVKQASDLVIDFLGKTKGETVSFNDVQRNFFLNDPDYCANLICKTLQKHVMANGVMAKG